ncbi:hypothetical protein QQX10_01985 [Demequina sp. SYSU T00039]|uniref:DUF3558 domain-containing protein n=1 Tax=Demequina lignilytica TaxID=3051663 RepID=A0AAW7M504_9MICO|nr:MULTISPECIES: hypothetical protein [unclassified Demequina]MDN4478562.1 hypothetical protein [Demequina sp. SYSU T00039-1]MDN4486931.1 hypothetical protein [Demequina sp. SYSU T00039]
MRITKSATAAALAATAGILLAGCTADSASEETPTASASAVELNVGDLLATVKASADCPAWVGGKVAGEGVVAGWEYTCDADGDEAVDATLTIYTSADARDGDLAAIEAADASAGIVVGDGFVFVTNDPADLASVGELGEIVREIGGE